MNLHSSLRSWLRTASQSALRGGPPALGACSTAIFLALALFASIAHAGTAIDLSDRIVIDGSTADYLDDETIFQRRVVQQGDSVAVGSLEESTIDSKWGRFNDINNVRITWDAHYLYVAVEGYSFNNNMMILPPMALIIVGIIIWIQRSRNTKLIEQA